MKLDPYTGRMAAILPCRIPTEDGDTVQGAGEVAFNHLLLAELAQKAKSHIAQWSSAEHAASIVPTSEGWSVWAPSHLNLGPLRNEEEYRRQVARFRAAGMRPVQRG